MSDRPEGFTDAQWHSDALADTNGDAYTQFHGYVLTCLWCDFSCRAPLHRDAKALMNRHYDALHEQLVKEDAEATA